jgi:hypothetical protein
MAQGKVAMNATPTTRLPSRWLWPARIAWVLLLLLATWKLVLGTPLIYAEKLVVCTASAEECAKGISPSREDVQVLEAAGVSLQEYARWTIIFGLFETVFWMGVGVLIFILRPDDWLALVVSSMMILYTSGSESDPIIRAYPSLGWMAQLGFSLQNALLFLFVGLFPSGRFAPRWMKWYWIAMMVLALGGDDILFRILPGIRLPADWIWVPGWLSFLILGPYSQIYRYRKVSTPTERLQTRWVVFGFVAMAGFIITGFLLGQMHILPSIVVSDFFFGLGAFALPLSIGVSVLRYRLWDIDVIIRKTLVYGGLTLTLALVYFGSIILLQSLVTAVGGQQTAVATVISTLVIAALFTPLRKRIQNDIDRRFFRKKYDAEKTLDAFSANLRQELDLEELSERLLGVVEETMQPESVSLWMRKQIAGEKKN